MEQTLDDAIAHLREATRNLAHANSPHTRPDRVLLFLEDAIEEIDRARPIVIRHARKQ